MCDKVRHSRSITFACAEHTHAALVDLCHREGERKSVLIRRAIAQMLESAREGRPVMTFGAK